MNELMIARVISRCATESATTTASAATTASTNSEICKRRPPLGPRSLKLKGIDLGPIHPKHAVAIWSMGNLLRSGFSIATSPAAVKCGP